MRKVISLQKIKRRLIYALDALVSELFEFLR